jgi:hypothetical protein
MVGEQNSGATLTFFPNQTNHLFNEHWGRTGKWLIQQIEKSLKMQNDSQL